MAKKALLGDQLRRAIRGSKDTHYRIGKNAGVAPDQIDRFMRGRDVRVSTAGRLADALGLELQPKKAG